MYPQDQPADGRPTNPHQDGGVRHVISLLREEAEMLNKTQQELTEAIGFVLIEPQPQAVCSGEPGKEPGLHVCSLEAELLSVVEHLKHIRLQNRELMERLRI